MATPNYSYEKRQKELAKKKKKEDKAKQKAERKGAETSEHGSAGVDGAPATPADCAKPAE